MLRRCSIRLLKNGRYISVTTGNHLLFRVAAYSDAGVRQDADAFIVWPKGIRLTAFSTSEQKAAIAFDFKLFDGVTLALSSANVLAMTERDWRHYCRACEEAWKHRHGKAWPSNVSVGRAGAA